MSLLNEMFEEFVYINKNIVDDGLGGFETIYVDGATFNAVAVLDSSMESRIAEKQGVTSLYTITTNREMTLSFHDVIRRKSDGKVFRVTSDGEDKKTPVSSRLNMRQVTAEEWVIP